MEEHWGNEKSTGNFNRDYKVRRIDGYEDNEEPKVRKFVRWSRISIPKMRITENFTGYSTVLEKEDWDELRVDQRYQQFLNEGALTVQEVFMPAIREM